MTQPPYSLDLVPYDFWLFPKLKSPLKGKRFQTIDKILENTTGKLMVIPIKDFEKCFDVNSYATFYFSLSHIYVCIYIHTHTHIYIYI